jgi:putative two-component system response regulator
MSEWHGHETSLEEVQMEYKILIVDDNMVNIKMAKNILQDEYKVATADSGEAAFKILEQMSPDLILLDVNMPGMDGFQVLEKLKASKETEAIPVIFLTADQSPEVETRALKAGAEDFVAKPFIPSVLQRRISRCIQVSQYQKQLEYMVELQTEAVIKREKQVSRLQQEMIVAMANIIESRDGSTGGHVKRTGRYVALLVDILREENYHPEILTDDYVRMLCNAAYMHDIGKITIDDAILRKPGRFTPEEYEIMKKHAPNGGEIIRKTMSRIEEKEYVNIASDMATYHHERWDGNGYPEGLSGTNIPLCARIMSLADVFDALTSVRCYKDAMPEERAFSIMTEESGKQFDPELIGIMLAYRDAFAAQLHEFMREASYQDQVKEDLRTHILTHPYTTKPDEGYPPS